MSRLVKQPAVILIGGGELALPHVATASQLGCKVFVTDIRDDAPAVKFSEGFLKTSGDDVSTIIQYGKKINEQFDVVGAYGGADFAVRSANALARSLGRPAAAPEAIELSFNKYQSKKIWRINELPTPRCRKYETVGDLAAAIENHEIELPFIVKPLDSCGSQGVRSVLKKEEVVESFAEAKKFSSMVLAEEIFDGIGIDINGIMWNGEFLPQGMAQRFFSSPPFHFPIYGISPPLALSATQVDNAYRLLEKACHLCGLDNTPVKGDFLFGNNEFSILEVSPRFHGDVVTSKLLPYASGTDPFESWVSLLMDKDSGLNYLNNDVSNNRLTIWKALIPLHSEFDYKSVDLWLREYSDRTEHCDYQDFVLDARKYENWKLLPSGYAHKDNSSVIGFFWVSFESEVAFKEFENCFYRKFGDFLL